MRRIRFTRIAVCVLAGCLLIPALIQGTRPDKDASRRNPFVKLPDAVTVGPESGPYALTRSEREKLALVIPDEWTPEPRALQDKATFHAGGEYTGLTDIEMQKHLRGPAQIRFTGRPDAEQDPVSTIEIIHRAAGREGLTKMEKEKLDAVSRKSRSPK